MQTFRDGATCLDGVLFEQLADQLLVSFFACAKNFDANEVEMEFLFLHEFASRIPDEREAASHAGAEIRSGRSKHDHRASGHVLAGVIAHAFDNCCCSGVANGEAFSGAPSRE